MAQKTQPASFNFPVLLPVKEYLPYIKSKRHLRLFFQDPPFFQKILRPGLNDLPVELGIHLSLLHSRIVAAQIEIGYMRQNLEQSLETLTEFEALLTLRRLHPLCPLPYQMAVLLAFEQLRQLHPSEETDRYRAIIMELHRILHHLGVLTKVFLALDRPLLLKQTQNIASILKPLKPMLADILHEPDRELSTLRMQSLIMPLEDAFFELIEDLKEDEPTHEALSHKGVVNGKNCLSLGLTGIFLRASGIHYDVRNLGHSGILYSHKPICEIEESGDMLARLFLRCFDCRSSSQWLNKVFLEEENRPKWNRPLFLKAQELPKEMPLSHSQISLEIPEGELMVTIKRNPAENQRIFRIRVPAFFIAQALAHLLFQMDICDIPILLCSLGINATEVDK